MTIAKRQFFLYLFSLSDLSLLAFALYASILWKGILTPLSVLGQKRVQVHTIAGIAVLFFLWNIALSLLGLYRSKRLDPYLPEIVDMLKASIGATLLLSFVSLVFNIRTFGPFVVFRFLLLAAALLIVSRLTLRRALRSARLRGHNLRHLLIVGTNARAVAFANSIAEKPGLGYRITGFVDDRWAGPPPNQGAAANLVSDIADFRTYLRHNVVDEVVVALPIKSFYDHVDEMLQICQEHGVIARILTDLFETSTAATEITHLGADPVVSFYTVPIDEVGLGTKRILDVLASLCLVSLLSPVMLMAAICVRLDSEGPILFAQERIGLNKRRFRIYKFRTMVANAEKMQAHLERRNEAQGPVFKIKDDPRITRVGRLLRKTSIDELPQLFNVLKGDMSLVGPRPLPLRDYSGFNNDWQRRRFSVRPGITCLWQVSGRSGVSFEQWMRLDMEYIDGWSLWLDVKILMRTIPAVVRGVGAI